MADISKKFRDKEKIASLVKYIKKISEGKEYTFMHVCGTHEQTIARFNLRAILPSNVKLIAGPGCPVCITPAKDIDTAIKLAEKNKVLTYGDMLRVPGTRDSLFTAKAKGADVGIVYSIKDAKKIAEKTDKNVVFFSPGFETTACTVATEVLNGLPENMFILSSLRLIPPIMELLLGIGDIRFEGYIAPGHVSAVIGYGAYEYIAKAYHMPIVVAGFEPLDILLAVALLIRQIKKGVAKVENEYSWVVTKEGNAKAKRAMEEAFYVASDVWRGIGRVPFSALKLKNEEVDAEKVFKIKIEKSIDIKPNCSCHLVIIGKISPFECKMFAKACTPENPYGACMVSSEGTCYIAYMNYANER